jgi:hypothetical protein
LARRRVTIGRLGAVGALLCLFVLLLLAFFAFFLFALLLFANLRGQFFGVLFVELVHTRTGLVDGRPVVFANLPFESVAHRRLGRLADVRQQVLVDRDFGDLFVVKRSTTAAKNFYGCFEKRHVMLLV